MLDLGNFLWDMVQYFKAAHVLKDRVDIGSMYVPSSPILGRLNCGDYYRVVISEILKKSSKKNFLLAIQRGLQGKGLKEFSSLMIDIENMFEEDGLFMSGLQIWT